jgi:hypothetical protein
MRRFFLVSGLSLFVAVCACSCGGDKIDGQLSIQLTWVCDPPIEDFAAQIDIYCIRVIYPGNRAPDENCASSLEGLNLAVDETSGLVMVEVVGLTSVGETLVRGRSTPVRLVSGEATTVTIPALPVGNFSLLAADSGLCRPLPYHAVDHSATVFPSGHVLVAGSARPDEDPTRIAFLLDPVTNRLVVLNTPPELYRYQHSATLLDDGRLVVLGGQNQLGSAPQDILLLRGAESMMKPYDRAVDYSLVSFEDLGAGLMVPRARHLASLFFGNQVLVNDGERTAEMFLGSREQSGFVAVDGSDPFPASGKIATVVPIDGERALVLGGETNHNGLLTVQDNTRGLGFTPFNLQVAARDRPVGVALGDELVMFIGGLAGAMVGEPPVVIVDPGGPAIFEVPVDEPAFPQRGFSATLLPDGRVFVVGGASARAQYQPGSTFLFERQAGGDITKWNSYPGPRLIRPRAYHTASLLPDGRLIVIGGVASGPDFTNQQVASSAEVIAF